MCESPLAHGMWAGFAAIRREVTTSRAGSIAARLQRRCTGLAAADRCQLIGVGLLAAAIRQYGLSLLQPPHQLAVAAPAVALIGTIVGLVLTFGGHALEVSRSTSRVVRAFERRADGRELRAESNS